MKKVKLALIYSCIFALTFTFNLEVNAKVLLAKNQASNVALLIGINKYPNLPEQLQLRCCINDVDIMEKLLIEKFQFEKNNIRILKDEQATRTNILKNFEDFLISKATTNGQAVLFYSGHGSQMTDLNYEESDMLDETIVPYDSRDSEGDIIDISDDILGELLGRLTDNCKNVTFILDCCHSGAAIRGANIYEATTRLIPPLKLEQPKAKSFNPIKDGPTGFLPPNPDYVLISACSDREEAVEYAGNGVLTSALNEVMRNHPNATYREIMYDVTNKLNIEKFKQTPQLEGKRRDAKIFGNLGIVENFIEVMERKDNRIKINAGAAHNVTKNSIYALYKPGTTSTKQDKNYLGDIKIAKVNPFTSWAEITDEKEKIIKNAAAFETEHHYGDFQLAVRLEIKNSPHLVNKIKTVLEKEYKEKEDLVKIVSEDEKYNIKIRFDKTTSKLILQRHNKTVLVEIGTDENSIKYKLTEVLTKEARRMNIHQLSNKPSKLSVNMSLKAWEDVDDDLNPVNEIQFKETEGGQRYLNIGDVIKLKIENKSDKAVHVYLLDLGTDGSVSLLFPAEGAQDSPLEKGNSIETGLMRISPPEGLNGLKVIATTVPTDFSVLVQRGYRSIDDKQTSKKGMDSPLGKLLNMAWGGKRNVEEIKPQKIEDWTTDMISFMIREK